MSTPTRLCDLPRSRSGRLAGALVALAMLAGSALLSAPAAVADTAVTPKAGRFTVKGAGFGHGFGMSQYGAYGAARKGLSWQKILAFYYPGTTLTKLPKGTTIKVWITADRDGSLRVRPAPGLKVRDTSGHSFTVPTGSRYTSWRISRSGSGYKLQYRRSNGSYTTVRTGLSSGTWSFSTTSKVVSVVMPSGSVRKYHGSVGLAKRGGSGRTVNTVSIEDYVKGVVASEMPTSWAMEAVRAQAVAARSYAIRIRNTENHPGYDICDTPSCQVYGGIGHETARGNAAVRGTNLTVVTYAGKVAFTQFASSNGGHTAQGSYAYLKARTDPYDSVVRSQAWSRTITAASIARAWGVGTVQKVTVTTRDGQGKWGGRVKSVKITGSRKTVTVSGYSFKARFGLRSTLFTLGGAPTNDPAPSPTPPPVLSPGQPYAAFPRSYDSRSKVDLTLVTANGSLARYPVSKGKVGTGTLLRPGMGGYEQVVNAGDWNGDGYQDVIARAGNKLYLFKGTRRGTLAGRVSMGFGAGISSLVAMDDVNGDRHPDLAVISTAGNLWFYYGDGHTGRAGRTMISTGWGKDGWLRSPGDVNGDGRPDLITLRGKTLYLHRGAAGGLARPQALTSDLSGIAGITAVGDLTGDRRPDMIGRTASGRLVLFKGTKKHKLTRGATLAGTWAGARFVV